jgi:hypothetical protein
MVQALVLWAQSSEDQLQALADREEQKEGKD